MVIPKNVEIPKASGQFAKLQYGANRYRFLSDVVIGWEGWKDNKPFRHEGGTCRIKPDQVDMNKQGMPNINYFWAAVVWNCTEKKIQVLQLTQKTIMGPLYELEQNEDWGDLKNYDINITKNKEGDKTKYTVLGIPPKPLAEEIKQAYEESDVDLSKLFSGEYPMPIELEPIVDENGEEIPF